MEHTYPWLPQPIPGLAHCTITASLHVCLGLSFLIYKNGTWGMSCLKGCCGAQRENPCKIFKPYRCSANLNSLCVCVWRGSGFFYDPIIPPHLASGASEVLTTCLLNEEMNRMSSDVSRPEGG